MKKTNLINNDILNMEEKSLKEYLDSLILKEFAHKKDSPFLLELLQMVSEITVVIPIGEAVAGKTLFTKDNITETEGNYKIVSGTVSLVTLGYGAIAAKGSGLAISRVLAAELVSEVAADATIITCERVGAPSGVTVALAIIAGSAAGIKANKVLLKNHSVVDIGDVVGGADQSIKGAGISEADRLKLSKWKFKPSDEFYMKYKKVFDDPGYYDQATGNIHWPKNDGFMPGSKLDIDVDDKMVFKRYGEPSGEFLGNATDSFESRALAPHSDGAKEYYYRPTEKFKITSGKAAPWFGSSGGGYAVC